MEITQQACDCAMLCYCQEKRSYKAAWLITLATLVMFGAVVALSLA